MHFRQRGNGVHQERGKERHQPEREGRLQPQVVLDVHVKQVDDDYYVEHGERGAALRRDLRNAAAAKDRFIRSNLRLVVSCCDCLPCLQLSLDSFHPLAGEFNIPRMTD